MTGDTFPLEGLVDAKTVAAFCDASVTWVYEHKAQLGVVVLGRRMLRFEAAQVRAYVRTRRVGEKTATPRAQAQGARRGRSTGFELLPLPREAA